WPLSLQRKRTEAIPVGIAPATIDCRISWSRFRSRLPPTMLVHAARVAGAVTSMPVWGSFATDELASVPARIRHGITMNFITTSFNQRRSARDIGAQSLSHAIKGRQLICLQGI